MGITPGGAAAPNGTDFWWDDYAGNTGNCWWANVAAPGRLVTTSPSTLPDCANATDRSLSQGTGSPQNESELSACLVGFTVESYPQGDKNLCDWTTTPGKPGSARAARSAAGGSAIARERQRQFMALCRSLPRNNTCAPFVTDGAGAPAAAAPSRVSFEGAWARRALGLCTCADWRRASAGLQTKLLARLRRFAGGPVDGDVQRGYGSTLTDDRARALFDTRCAPRYAGAFALYKLYGQAAAFAGA